MRKVEVELGNTLVREARLLTARVYVWVGWYSTCPKFQFCS